MEIISRHKIHFQNLPWFFPCLKVKLERSNFPCLIPRLLLIFGSQLPYFRVLFRDIENLPLFCKDTRESEWLSLFIHLGSSPCYALLGEIFSGYNLESKGYSLHWEPPPSSLVNAQLEEERQRSDSFQSPMGFSALTKFPQFLFFHLLVELCLPFGEKIWLFYHHEFICPLVDEIDEIDC